MRKNVAVGLYRFAAVADADSPRAGMLDADLGSAARRALEVPSELCRAHALGFS